MMLPRRTLIAAALGVQMIAGTAPLRAQDASVRVASGPASDATGGARDNRGFDYLAVCVFAELVTGYTLPQVNDAFFRNNRQVTRLPTADYRSAKEPARFRLAYRYVGDGVSGTVRRDGAEAFFQSFRIAAKKPRRRCGTKTICWGFWAGRKRNRRKMKSTLVASSGLCICISRETT